MFRDTLRHALDRAPGLRVVAVAGDGIGTVREAERARPDVAMVDADLPNGDGVKTTALVKRRVPGCRVVVLADADDEATLIDAVAAGADGFLSREYPLDELIEGVRRVREEMLVPRHLLRPLIAAGPSPPRRLARPPERGARSAWPIGGLREGAMSA